MFVTENDNYVGAVERISKEMMVSGISKKDLAERSGISYANLNRVLKGNYVAMTPVFLKKVSHALGKSPLYIGYGIE